MNNKYSLVCEIPLFYNFLDSSSSSDDEDSDIDINNGSLFNPLYEAHSLLDGS